jgi:hypothetical protein
MVRIISSRLVSIAKHALKATAVGKRSSGTLASDSSPRQSLVERSTRVACLSFGEATDDVA